MSQYLTDDERYDRARRDRGWFDETPFEALAGRIIEDLRKRIDEETEPLQERIDDLEGEQSYLQERVANLQMELDEALEDRDNGRDEGDAPEESDEISFLNDLITELENELAAIDGRSDVAA